MKTSQFIRVLEGEAIGSMGLKSLGFLTEPNDCRKTGITLSPIRNIDSRVSQYWAVQDR